ncbi:MAG: murein biosynthesis integral membrane protein MurJ [Thiotrichaceae bacterium]|nr:murein biosynthesis integral membrane protein MurJ [Thiotrichaceae bacterium]
MGSLLRSSMAISAMTLISRVLGLIRDMVFFHIFAVGGATDAFFAANRIPNLLRRFVAEGAFSLAFVPVLTEYKEKEDQQVVRDLISHVATTLGIILFIISVLGVIFAPIIMMIFAPGFFTKPDAEPDLAIALLRITFPYIFFISLSALASGILNTWGRFAVPAFTPVLLNISMIVAMLIFSPYFEEPITAVAWGVFFGGVLQLAFQMPALYRLGLIPKFRFKRKHKGVGQVLKLMIPALLGSSVAQINLLINTIIASMLGLGFVTWLYSSDRLVELPLALIGVALGVVILPNLSADFANTNTEKFRQKLNWAIQLAMLIALPAMLGLMILAKPILGTIIYKAGAWHDIDMASMSLFTYAFGLPAFILVKVLVPGFYARKDSKTPVKIGIYAVLLNILLSVIIVYPWYHSGLPGPHAGLALAVALAGYANAITLAVVLSKQGLLTLDRSRLVYFGRIALASIVMASLLMVLNPDISWWRTESVVWRVAMIFGLIIAVAIAYLATLQLLGVRLKALIKPPV